VLIAMNDENSACSEEFLSKPKRYSNSPQYLDV
jgi:hypothetical protein